MIMRSNIQQYIIRIIVLLILTIGISNINAQTIFVPLSEDKISAAPGEPKRIKYGDGSVTLQATHEQKQVIYVKNGEKKTLHIPTTKVQAYQRWFRYDSIKSLPTGFTINTSANTLSPTYHGVVKTNGINYRPQVSYATKGMTFACDLSTKTMSGGKEDTLSYRMIYEIRDASEIATKLDSSSMTSPLEYYEMTAPTGRQLLIGPRFNYLNGTSAGSDANNYTIKYESNYYIKVDDVINAVSYGASSTSKSVFRWYCEELPSKSITESNKYCMKNSDIVNDYVYNGRILALEPVATAGTVRNWYLINEPDSNCIAHFKITYESPDIVGPKLDSIKGKSKKSLEQSYRLLVERNFNYTDVDASTNQFTSYPLPWSESSYGFSSNAKNTPTWSQYGFFKTFPSTMSWCYKASDHSGNGRMYYIDASETPGVISNLDISQACCSGTQIHVSTWIHNINNEGKLGPNMNFEIVGIQSDGTEEIFKSYTTGTIACNKGAASGTESNGWLQVFFSTTVPKSNYTKMYFRIINNQLSSAGNDFAIDDIAIYMMKPAVSAEVRAPMCGNSAVAHVNIDYNKLLEIVAMSSETKNEAMPIGYCFVDKIIYDNYLDHGLDKHGNTVNELDRTEENAFKEARVECASTAAVGESKYFNYFILRRGFEGEGTQAEQIHNYYLNEYISEPNIKDSQYANISNYNTDYAKLLASTNNKIFRSTVKDENNVDVDGLSFQATLKSSDDMPIAAGRDYYIIFNIQCDYIENSNISQQTFESLIDPSFYTKSKICDIVAEFELLGTAVFDINGSSSLFYGGTDMCANTRPTFTVKQLTYILNGEVRNLDTQSLNIYFDWFHGDFSEFEDMKYYPRLDESNNVIGYTEEANDKGVFSVSDALGHFRDLYPSAKTIEGYSIGDEYTLPMKSLLADLSKDAESGNESDKALLLYKRNFSPIITEPLGTIHSFLAIPVSSVALTDTTSEWAGLICLDPQQIIITASSSAPSIGLGLDTLNYGKLTNVPLRIGLSQLKEITSSVKNPSLSKSSRYLKLPIQKQLIDFSADDFTDILNVDNNSSRYQKIYLVDSDDPDDLIERAIINNDVMGYINTFDIKNNNNTNDYVAIFFSVDDNGNMPITLREGYTYEFKFYFSEYIISDDIQEQSNVCEGSVIVPLKIVPEYQVWIGDVNMRNWNNDNNWRRANAEDYYAPNTYKSNTEYYNTDILQTSFVPLSFTKVIIDQKGNNTPSLVGLSQKGGGDSSLDLSTDENMIGETTSNIEYDLVIGNKITKDGDEFYICTSFYGNTCEEIYFKPGSSLMNPHYLKYDTARVEFTIDTKRWYLLGSPLQGVVAGDMYTLNSGIQSTNAFESIFYNTIHNNRYNPHIYQRGWDKVQATVYDFNGGSSSPALQTQRNVAVKAAWSSVYNEVAVPYLPGVGYSIKSVPALDNDKEHTTIRLPKGDMAYRYYTAGNQTDTADDKNVASLKTHSGRLASDKLTSSSSTLKVDLSTLKDGSNHLGNNDLSNKLYLLANPFMTFLNMQEFFEVNTFFKKGYWLMKADGEGKQIGIIMDSEGVVGSSEDATTTIAPMQGFFVELADNASANPIVTYSINMMGNPTDPCALTRSSNGIRQLYITSSRDGVSGTTSLRLADDSANDSEIVNLPTLLDSNWEPYPMIYTIGNNQAMQIQTVRNVSTIPLGIYSNSADEVVVAFNNVSEFDGLTLYDSYLNTSTELSDDISIMLPGNTNGRYLLTFSSTIEDDLTESITISSVERGSIWITSDINDPIQEIIIYDVEGRMCNQLTSVNKNSYTVHLEAGIYIVQVHTLQASKTSKVIVRD